ncbi:hypothetical protein [Candidatus Poriferisodalis sp.]|uniref:hypothetical protein n=1 Tax=Candidatus Poriferisodalis sp. TaxID=3101277 RepID=UPI003B015A66
MGTPIIRITGAFAAAIMLTAACSNSDTSTRPRDDDSPISAATGQTPAVTDEDTDGTTTSPPSDDTITPDTTATSNESVGTTEVPEGTSLDATSDTGTTGQSSDQDDTPVADAPEVTVTAGPQGTTSGRDENGEGGVFVASWNVTPADADCGLSLDDTDGNSVVHETSVFDTSGETRTIEILYNVTAGKLPITMKLGCVNGNSPQTLVELPVEIVEPEPEPEVKVKNYENRSANSVFPATDRYYFDHDEIRALFPECAPYPTPASTQAWLDEFLGFWDSVYADWDTERTGVGGRLIASGWWTTEQIRIRWPESQITAESARDNATYNSQLGYLYLWSREETVGIVEGYYYYPHKANDGRYVFQDLYQRAALSGYSSTDASPATVTDLLRVLHDDGISAPGPNPPSVDVGQMIAEWTIFRYQQPPSTAEPAAWAMLTLLETRDSNCFVPLMRTVCESGEPHESVHLRHPSQGGSRMGAALWNMVCPDIEQ